MACDMRGMMNKEHSAYDLINIIWVSIIQGIPVKTDSSVDLG